MSYQSATERIEYADTQRRLKQADAIIAEMSDDDIRAEWTPILMTMTGKPREWAEQWDMGKVRGNVRFRMHVGMLVGEKAK